MSDRDYSVRLDAPDTFKLRGMVYSVKPQTEVVDGDIGYYTIGQAVVLELIGTVYTSAGPDFSTALNGLRADILKGA